MNGEKNSFGMSELLNCCGLIDECLLYTSHDTVLYTIVASEDTLVFNKFSDIKIQSNKLIINMTIIIIIV